MTSGFSLGLGGALPGLRTSSMATFGGSLFGICTSARLTDTLPATSSRSRAIPLMVIWESMLAVTMLLAMGWAFLATISRSTGMPFCSTPTVPVTVTSPGAARAVTFSMRSSPWSPVSVAVMSVRLIPWV